MRYLLGLLIVLSFLIGSCAHRGEKATRARQPKLSKIIAQNKASNSTNMSGQNSIKDYKNTKNITEQNEIGEVAAKNWMIPENDRLYFELSGEKYEDLNSQQIYEKINEKYRGSDLKAVETYTNLLLIKYPQSHFADNALYLEGMLAFSIKTYAKSLDCFQKIIKLYPNGNKAVSALFAKGVLYKKMNLKVESENVLANIKIKYPGSPESLRADAEIR